MYDVCTYILYYRYINAKEEEGDRLLYIAEVNINRVKTSRAYTFIYIYKAGGNNMSASHRRNRTPKGNRPKSHNEIRKRRGNHKNLKYYNEQRNRIALQNRPRSSSSVHEHRNLRRPGTAPMRITQTQTFYAYENVGDEKNDDSGFIESDEDEDASFYNYDISPSVISNRNGSTYVLRTIFY